MENENAARRHPPPPAGSLACSLALSHDVTSATTRTPKRLSPTHPPPTLTLRCVPPSRPPRAPPPAPAQLQRTSNHHPAWRRPGAAAPPAAGAGPAMRAACSSLRPTVPPRRHPLCEGGDEKERCVCVCAWVGARPGATANPNARSERCVFRRRSHTCALFFRFVSQQPPPSAARAGRSHAKPLPSALATACTSGQREKAHTHAHKPAMAPKAKASKRESGEEVLTRIAIVSADR